MQISLHLDALVNALVFSILGVIILILAFRLWDLSTPYNLWKEIVEEQNMALAIFAGLMALGIAIIVAAAVH